MSAPLLPEQRVPRWFWELRPWRVSRAWLRPSLPQVPVLLAWRSLLSEQNSRVEPARPRLNDTAVLPPRDRQERLDLAAAVGLLDEPQDRPGLVLVKGDCGRGRKSGAASPGTRHPVRMTKSPLSKPPVSKAKIRTRLERAQAEEALVRITRWIPDADRVEGFVVGLSREWLILHRLSDRLTFDGWISVRVQDIQAVTIYPTEDCFEIAALSARGLWPPTSPAPTPKNVVELLTEAKAHASVVAVHREFERPDVAWCGAIRNISSDTLTFLEVNVAGGWGRKPRRFDLDDITRVDFGGGYEEALELVAGPPPRSRGADAQ